MITGIIKLSKRLMILITQIGKFGRRISLKYSKGSTGKIHLFELSGPEIGVGTREIRLIRYIPKKSTLSIKSRKFVKALNL